MNVGNVNLYISHGLCCNTFCASYKNPVFLEGELPFSLIPSKKIIISLLFIWDDGKYRDISAYIFLLALITDYLDGYIARNYDQTTAFGAFLDPIADKLLVASVILILTSKNIISDWETIPALIILLREITVSGLREYLAGIKVSIPVSRIAKLKTLLQLCALALLILSESISNLAVILYLGKIFLWVSALLTLYTAYDYVKGSIKHF